MHIDDGDTRDPGAGAPAGPGDEPLPDAGTGDTVGTPHHADPTGQDEAGQPGADDVARQDATVVLPAIRSRRFGYATTVLLVMSVIAVIGLVTLLLSVTIGDEGEDGTGPAIGVPAQQPGGSAPAGRARPADPSGTRRPASASGTCSARSCPPSGTVPASAQPPAPTTPSTQPTTAQTSPSTAAVTAAYNTVTVSANSFRGRLTVTNTTSAAQSWQVVLQFPAGVGVTSVTAGSFAVSGQQTTFTGSALTVRQTLVVEFNAVRPYQAAYVPTGCTVNGIQCG